MREIARQTGLSRNTVRRYLREPPVAQRHVALGPHLRQFASNAMFASVGICRHVGAIDALRVGVR